jgi:hypothetical protein
MTDAEIKSALDQTTMGVAVLAVCIVQALRESDPTIVARVRLHARDWHHRLADRGDSDAAGIVARFGRALSDPELFPTPTS